MVVSVGFRKRSAIVGPNFSYNYGFWDEDVEAWLGSTAGLLTCKYLYHSNESAMFAHRFYLRMVCVLHQKYPDLVQGLM